MNATPIATTQGHALPRSHTKGGSQHAMTTSSATMMGRRATSARIVPQRTGATFTQLASIAGTQNERDHSDT